MKKKIALLSILFIIGIALAGGFYGNVTKVPSGNPLPGASVHIWHQPGQGTYNDTVTAGPGGGYWDSPLNDGDYYLQAWKQEGDILWQSYVIPATIVGGRMTNVDIPCSQFGSE